MNASRLVRIDPCDQSVDLVLVRGRGNALDRDGLVELETAVGGLRQAGAPALVVRAEGKSFCTGLDLDAACSLDRAGMRALMEAFHRALAALAGYPGPVVAAISGHALAGGALLALTADRRMMVRGRARFGVHGVQLGVSYPQVAIEIARAQLGERGAERLLYGGELCEGELALREGWVDALAAAGEDDALIGAARLAALQQLDPHAAVFSAHKLALRRPWLERLTDIDARGMDAWLDQWFSEQTQARLAAARRSDRTPTADRGRR